MSTVGIVGYGADLPINRIKAEEIAKTDISRRYRLEAGRCRKCGKAFLPPRLVCYGYKAVLAG